MATSLKIQEIWCGSPECGGYRFACIGYAQHDEHKTVQPIAHYGPANISCDQVEEHWSDDNHPCGPAGLAIRTGETQIVQDAKFDISYLPWREHAVREGYGSVLCIPLASNRVAFGVICIFSHESNGFEAEEITLLTELADDLAFGVTTLRNRIAHEKSVERFRLGMEKTIQAMSIALEMRDAYTAGHQRRVSGLAVAIAQEMQLPEEQIHGLQLAAEVHDLGKIKVPAEILSKPSRLTAIEYELIKTHAEAGFNILKDIEFSWPIAQIVYQHHERIDGSGYPRGLRNEEILLEARILAVADTVEAMATHRPYRVGLGIEKALDEIETNCGKLYDSSAVNACLRLFREKGFKFPN